MWGESPEYVQQVLTELERCFLELGLSINAKKTHVISNQAADPTRLDIGGVQVTPDGPDSIMTILGESRFAKQVVAPSLYMFGFFGGFFPCWCTR